MSATEFAALNTTVTAMQASLDAAVTAISENSDADATQQKDLDVLWLLFGAYLVFFMQVGLRKNSHMRFLFPPRFQPFFFPS